MRPAPVNLAADAPPNPAIIFETLNAYQRTEALRGAIELGLFTAVGKSEVTAAELTKRLTAKERSVRILADTLCVFGFLEKHGEKYRLSPTSAAFLDRDSPMYLGGTIEFLSSETLRESFRKVAETVKTGRTQLPASGTVSDGHPVWEQFANAMAPMMRFPAKSAADCAEFPLETPLRVLDVSASHGEFGFAFARRFPKSTVYALDWENVLGLTRRNAAANGLEKQMRWVPGDAFEVELPPDLDVVLAPNFLHHFSAADNVRFLKRAFAALRKGGTVQILEFVPDDGRVTPPGPAAFALVMLCTTLEGDAYTFGEYREMLEAAGFAGAEIRLLEGGMQSLIRATKT